MTVFPVFLDACALVPIRLTDVLLRLAEAGTYRPLWSADVLAEVERTLVVRFDVPAHKAARRIRLMRAAFPEAEVTGYGHLVDVMTNDHGDRHVLAAAVRSGAKVIATANRRHFPASSLAPYDINAMHPDDFLLDQFDLYPRHTMRCLADLLAAKRNPPVSCEDFLAGFSATVPGFAAALRKALSP